MTTKKRILFLIESLGGGGAEKVLTTLVKYIDKERYDVTVCAIVDTGTHVEEVKQHVTYKTILPNPERITGLGKILYKIKYRLIYTLLPMSWVYRLWVPKGYDTEIAFCEGFATKLLAASTNREARKIAWVHIDLKYNPWPQKQGIFKNTSEETLAYSKFDKIITVSKTVEESFKEVYGLQERVQTIYNPIDVNDIRQQALCPSPNHLAEQGRCRLISIGRLAHQKGYDILLRVAKRLKEDGLSFSLTILGEGDQRNRLETYIEQNDLKDCVFLLGFQKNPYPYIANSDLFVCSSRSEGYSLVIAESLVLGIPVISTYCSGPNELLSEGEYGMLVANEESGEGLYLGLKSLICDKTLLSTYKEKAQERASFFSLDSTMNQIYKAIAE